MNELSVDKESVGNDHIEANSMACTVNLEWGCAEIHCHNSFIKHGCRVVSSVGSSSYLRAATLMMAQNKSGERVYTKSGGTFGSRMSRKW